MKIAVHGLGRMGSQIVQKLAENGHEVVAHNRSRQPIDEAVAHGAKAAYTKQDILEAFKDQRLVLWIMLPAEVVDEELDSWLAAAPTDSLFVDGGNSDYRVTKVRSQKIAQSKHSLVDVGTSGGVWGYENGFSMMVGGARADFELLEPAFKTLSQPRGGYGYFGESGTGHFVKMVHNAIEYGMMESLAEGYQVLKAGPYQGIDLAEAGRVWQSSSVVTSWLNELARQVLKENPELSGIEGIVAETGEARWTLETAKSLGLPMPAIQAAFDVRLDSQKGDIDFSTKLLAAIRNKFGGHKLDGTLGK